MTARKKIAIAGVVTALAATPLPASAAGSPLGVWIDHTGRGAVEITRCGSRLCGKLVWLKDRAKQKACGTQIIGGVGKVGRSWDNGWIYNPEERKKFDVELTPSGRNRLVVLGYMGTKLFSKEMIWTRAPANLDRCDVIEAKAKPKEKAVEKKAVAELPKDIPAPVRNPKLAKAEISEPVAEPKPAEPETAETPAPEAPAPQPTEAKAPVKAAASDPIEQVPVKKIEPKPEVAERDVDVDEPEETKQARAPQPRLAKRPQLSPKEEADAWASEPGRADRTRTAEAKVEVDVSDDVYVRVPDRSRAKSRKMCRVDAPFVTVEFPCGDD